MSASCAISEQDSDSDGDPFSETAMATSVKARKRVGGMSMELPTQRERSGGVPSSRQDRMVFIFMPALLAQVGLVEAILAWLYGHTWGVVMGALALAGGLALLGLQPRKFLSGYKRTIVLIFLSYVALLALIRLVSFRGWQDVVPDLAHQGDIFPEHCPPSKLLGCTRVALTEAHPDPKAAPPRLQVYLQDAVSAVEQWAAQEPRTSLLVKRREPMDSILTAGKSKCTMFMHMRALTLFMGFVDDVFVAIECFKERSPPSRPANPSGYVLISVQSQLRLGKGDLGVNGRRVRRLYDYVATHLGEREVGDCTKRLERTAT